MVTTRYQPRTEVERWQVQDRLKVRLSRVPGAARPRFFEAEGGRLAFRLWLGLKPAADVLAQLETIDDADRGTAK